MTNVVYPLFRVRQYTGTSIDLTAVDIRAVLLSSGYVFDATHEFRTEYAGFEIATSPNPLANVTISSAGVLDADDLTGADAFQTVSSNYNAIGLYVDTGAPATDRLIAYIDTGFTPIPGVGVNQNLIFSNSGIIQF